MDGEGDITSILLAEHLTPPHIPEFEGKQQYTVQEHPNLHIFHIFQILDIH